MLARLKEFVRGKLTHPDLDGEFNHDLTHVNRLLLSNPLNRDLDFNGFLATNFRARKAFEVRNAVEFASIQEAIDSLENLPGAIFIPPDTTFLETAQVNITSDVTIFGSGWTSIVQPASTLTGAPLFSTANNSRIKLLNFKIEGNGVTTGAFPAVDASSTTGTDFWAEGLWVTGWGNQATAITTVRHGIDVRGNKRARVWGCRFSTIMGSAVHCGADGASATDFMQLVSWNEIADLRQHGILAWTGNNVSVVHNQISNTQFSGIFLEANTTGTHRNVDLSDNQIQDTGNSGLLSFEASGIHFKATGGTTGNLRIARNQFYDINQAGGGTRGLGVHILFAAGSGGALDVADIKQNQIYLTQQDGILVSNASDTATIRNLSIDKNEVIDFSTSASAFDGIRVERTAAAGTDTVKNLAIRGNTVGRTTGSYTDGIDVTDTLNLHTTTGIIAGNTVFGTATGRAIKTSGARTLTIGTNSTPADDNSIYA